MDLVTPTWCRRQRIWQTAAIVGKSMQPSFVRFGRRSGTNAALPSPIKLVASRQSICLDLDVSRRKSGGEIVDPPWCPPRSFQSNLVLSWSRITCRSSIFGSVVVGISIAASIISNMLQRVNTQHGLTLRFQYISEVPLLVLGSELYKSSLPQVGARSPIATSRPQGPERLAVYIHIWSTSVLATAVSWILVFTLIVGPLRGPG